MSNNRRGRSPGRGFSHGLGLSSGKRSMESYKRDLEKLFKPGAETPERFKRTMKKIAPAEESAQGERKAAIKALKSVEGFREFTRAVLEFKAQLSAEDWAWPDDEDLLIRVLDHPDERVLRDALAHVAELTERQGWEREVALKSRLSTIKTMSEDPRTHRLVDAAAQALG